MTALCPVQIFAQDQAKNDNGLEEAIKAAKSKFDVPATFTEFTYEMYSDSEGRIAWNLTWNSKDGLDGSMYVRVDSKGHILNYNYYKNYSQQQSMMPKISKADAKAKADEFIKKIDPEIADQMKYIENPQQALMDMSYFFNYVRVVNNIPYNANNVAVEVNRQTGEVNNYYLNWSFDAQFPAAEKVISLEEAQKAYKDELGLELTYKFNYDEKQQKVYAAYTPKYNQQHCIDAVTGKRIDTSFDYYPGPMYGGRGGEKLAYSANSAFSMDAVNLTPDEQKAVQQASNFLSIEEAEKKARALKYLEISDDMKLSNPNLYKDWPSKENYIWHLNFVQESKDAKADTDKKVISAIPAPEQLKNISVAIDAKTGEVKSFYTSSDEKESDEPKLEEAAAKDSVEKFLKENFAATFANTKYDEVNKDIIKPYDTASAKPRMFNFRYTRTVNGISVPDNYLWISISAVTGKITNLEARWFNIEFPSVNDAAPIDTIYQKLFNDIGLELQYKGQYPNNYRIMSSVVKPDIKLVYAEKQGKPLVFDAKSGTILDYNGKLYKESKPAEYTDISGHFSEKYVKTLAEYGISFSGNEFKPDSTIIQKDFFVLLAKTMNYYLPNIQDENDADQLNQLYASLTREGIIKEGEKSPDSALTREDCVKYIIRALKYDKVADLKGIYNCPFKDIDQINPDLIGYVTIASGLNIINGDGENFNPKGQLTRGECAIVLYNYLNR